jgi:hypothetical protein
MFSRVHRRRSIWFSLMTFFILVSGGLLLISKGRAAAPAAQGVTNAVVSSSSLGEFAPTFAGPAATGCDSNGCALLTGPTFVPAVEPSAGPLVTSTKHIHRAMPDLDDKRYEHLPISNAPRINPPTVSCEPLGPGCQTIDTSSGGATGVKGLNAVDSAEQVTNVLGLNIEPPDQGLCAGNGYAVETNNQGEVLVFDTALHRKSAVIPLDTIMGLTAKGWSSGGDPSCLYDYDNGGHWFFTQIVSASTEANEGPFSGCFAGVANSCYEGIAVSTGSSPYGPYAVYFLSADYNPAEPGYPYLLNDFAKIGTSRDAFFVFYDEFPLLTTGLGGGFFNGAQELAFNKNALEKGLPVFGRDGRPNPNFTVAIENMGLLPTPNGTCFSG